MWRLLFALILVLSANLTGNVQLTMAQEEREFQLWIMDADGGNLQNLGEFPLAWIAGPAWSPDGKYIAFLNNGSLTLLEVTTGNRHDLPIDPDQPLIAWSWQPSWLPDGTRLLVGVGRQLDQGSLDIDLAVIDVASGALTLLPVQSEEPMKEWPGAWSPDGERIAFTGARHGDVSSAIFVVPAAGGAPVRLTGRPGEEFHWSPTWSPDGQQLAFILVPPDTGDLAGEIVIIDADGANWEQITTWETWARSVAWSPAGDRLAFPAPAGDNLEIHTIAPDGSDERNLTNHPANDLYPTWSPDGQRIAFVSDRDAAAAGASQVPAAAATAPPVTEADLPPCGERLAIDRAARTQTLTGACVTDEPIEIPEGWTLDGQGHTIWAVDSPGRQRLASGMGVLVAAGGAVTVRHVTIDGSRLRLGCDGSTALAGILLDQAGGEIADVQLLSLSRGAGRSCTSGLVIAGAATESVTVRNLTIDRPGAVGIHVRGAAARISGSTVTGAESAIRVDSGATVTLVENAVAASTTGLLVDGAGTHGVLSGNTITNAEAAIEISDGATAIVTDNTVAGAETPILTDNTAVGGAVGGIGLSRGATASVIGNRVRAGFGISVSGAGTEGDIRDNEISGNYGVYLSEATATVRGNAVEAQAVGVLVEAGTATIKGNIVATAGDGIMVVIDEAAAEVVGNTVTKLGEPTDHASNRVSGIRFGWGEFGLEEDEGYDDEEEGYDDDSRLSGRITDNTISGFRGEDGAPGCGIFIAAGASDVDLGDNQFPTPGNDTDVCDERSAAGRSR